MDASRSAEAGRTQVTLGLVVIRKGFMVWQGRMDVASPALEGACPAGHLHTHHDTSPLISRGGAGGKSFGGRAGAADPLSASIAARRASGKGESAARSIVSMADAPGSARRLTERLSVSATTGRTTPDHPVTGNHSMLTRALAAPVWNIPVPTRGVWGVRARERMGAACVRRLSTWFLRQPRPGVVSINSMRGGNSRLCSSNPYSRTKCPVALRPPALAAQVHPVTKRLLRYASGLGSHSRIRPAANVSNDGALNIRSKGRRNHRIILPNRAAPPGLRPGRRGEAPAWGRRREPPLQGFALDAGAKPRHGGGGESRYHRGIPNHAIDNRPNLRTQRKPYNLHNRNRSAPSRGKDAQLREAGVCSIAAWTNRRAQVAGSGMRKLPS